MPLLIDKDTVDGVSPTFHIGEQITVYAMGLESTDEVSLHMVILTDPAKPGCPCPPYNPTLPEVQDEVPLRCCGQEIILTRERPFVILNAPQRVKLRAKINNPGPLDTQTVWYEETTTKELTDEFRGCQCGDSPEPPQEFTMAIQVAPCQGGVNDLISVVINSGTPVSVTDNQNFQVFEGDTVELTAIGDGGDIFEEWREGTSAISTANPYVFTVTDPSPEPIIGVVGSFTCPA